MERLLHAFRGGVHSQAYLFTGSPRGIGKYTAALSLIETLFCAAETRPGGLAEQRAPRATRPCGRCAACQQVRDGIHPDVLILRPDAKGTIPIGDPERPEPGSVRHLIAAMSTRPVSGKRGVIIAGLDGASTAAQNALLKTIEEPPLGSVIIMTAVSTGSILRTIQSRAVTVRFAPFPRDAIMKILAPGSNEQSEAEFAALAGGGSVTQSRHFLDETNREALRDFLRSLITAAAGRDAAGPATVDPVLVDGALALLAAQLRDFRGEIINGYLSDLTIDAPDTIRKIITILLAVKKGSSRNLNASYHLRGLFGALASGTTDGSIDRTLSAL